MSEETRKFSEGIQDAIKDNDSIPEPAAEDDDAARQQAMQGIAEALTELLRWHVTQPGYIAHSATIKGCTALKRATPFLHTQEMRASTQES